MGYSIYFEVDNKEYKLPVNPEELSITKNQDVKEFDVLSLGKVAVPLGMKLAEISFDTEIPGRSMSYSRGDAGIKKGYQMIDMINKWREAKKIIKLIASSDEGDAIDMTVIISGLQYKEKAGEEGDLYVSFKLKEYKEWKVTEAVSILDGVIKEENKWRVVNPPKPEKKIYVIKQGDTLWAIARRFLGDGSKYTLIHKLNRDVIGDNPNLIYPDQKIVIPEVENGTYS